MKFPGLKIGLVAAGCAAIGTAGIFLHRQNERLRRRVAELRHEHSDEAPTREGNDRLRALLREQPSPADAAKAIHAELERVRAEVAAMEERAETRRAQILVQEAADTAELANNRDPNAGLARLEFFQNVGQATPRAACQTLVWAAIKGDDATLAERLFLPDTTRAKARELIASLPQAERRWTPEKLAALYFSAVVADVAAAQIVSETIDSPLHATVLMRIPGVAEAKSRLAMQLGPDGWKAVVDESAIDAMARRIAAAEKK